MKKINTPQLILRCNKCSKLIKLELIAIPYKIEDMLKDSGWVRKNNKFYCPEHTEEYYG